MSLATVLILMKSRSLQQSNIFITVFFGGLAFEEKHHKRELRIFISSGLAVFQVVKTDSKKTVLEGILTHFQ